MSEPSKTQRRLPALLRTWAPDYRQVKASPPHPVDDDRNESAQSAAALPPSPPQPSVHSLLPPPPPLPRPAQSVQSVQSVQSAQSAQSAKSPPTLPSSEPASLQRRPRPTGAGRPLGRNGVGDRDRADRPRRFPPSTEAIAALPAFDALDLDRITVVDSRERLAEVEAILLAETALGFDTESKPVFQRGVTNDGPHLAQFAARGQAWLIPLHVDGSIETLARVIGSTTVTKVGFGLDSDLTLLRRRLGREPRAVHDLDTDFRAYGYRGALGLKSAVAVLLGRRFTKSKRIGTSNWANRVLGPDQIRYAANDAWGAYCIHRALQAGAEPRDLEAPRPEADTPSDTAPRSTETDLPGQAHERDPFA